VREPVPQLVHEGLEDLARLGDRDHAGGAHVVDAVVDVVHPARVDDLLAAGGVGWGGCWGGGTVCVDGLVGGWTVWMGWVGLVGWGYGVCGWVGLCVWCVLPIALRPPSASNQSTPARQRRRPRTDSTPAPPLAYARPSQIRPLHPPPTHTHSAPDVGARDLPHRHPELCHRPVELGAPVQAHVGVGEGAGEGEGLPAGADEGAWGWGKGEGVGGVTVRGGVCWGGGWWCWW